MKKGIKITLGALGITGVLVGGVVTWQWQNVRAVSSALHYSKEELAEQIEIQKSEIESVLSEYGLENIGDFTLEEEEAIRKGTISFEEAIAKKEKRELEAKNNIENPETVEVNSSINQESIQEGQVTYEVANEAEQVPVKQEQQEKNEEKKNQTQKEDKKITEAAKSTTEQAINQMYTLKAKYLGSLGGLESQAVSEYKSAKAAGRNVTPASIASKYMSTAAGIQGQCDGEVAAVLSNLRSALIAQGESTEIVSVMQASYEREKELRKSYYLSLMK